MIDVDLCETYTDDLNSDSVGLEVEILRWQTKWERQDTESRPCTILSSIKHFNRDIYQSIFILLQILSTLSVTMNFPFQPRNVIKPT